MNTTLKYDKSFLSVNISGIENINHTEPENTISVTGFQKQLRNFFKPGTLRGKNILIIVSDKTRLCGYDIYLPVLEGFLIENNVRGLKFIIAYGTHKKQNEAEGFLAYGEIYKRYKFIHPGQNEPGCYLKKGVTSRGTEVILRKEIFENDVILAFGALSHHYFAGYGGGRKLLFPGLAAQKSIYQNHALFLDKMNNGLHAGCRPGNLAGNPLADDLKEIVSFLPGFTSINGILDSKGELRGVFITNTYEGFENVCGIYDSYYKIKRDKQYDAVIASCGGYPKDINFIQAHKGIHHASAFVKDGGKLFVFAGCCDGIGSDTFLPYFKLGHETAFQTLVGNYEGNGGTALSMMEKCQRIRIYMVTMLTPDECETIGVTKLEEREAIELFSSGTGDKALVENAGMVIKS